MRGELGRRVDVLLQCAQKNEDVRRVLLRLFRWRAEQYMRIEKVTQAVLTELEEIQRTSSER